jgi:hypothetical protein
MQQLSGLDPPGELIIGCVKKALANDSIRVAVFVHINPVHTFPDCIERRCWCVDLEVDAALDRERGKTDQKPDLNKLVRKGKDLDVCLLREAHDRTVVKLDLRAPVLSRVNPIGRLQSHVDTGSRPFDFLRVLKADVSLDEGQTGNPGVVFGAC